MAVGSMLSKETFASPFVAFDVRARSLSSVSVFTAHASGDIKLWDVRTAMTSGNTLAAVSEGI
jgi:hypothetical protein